MDKRAWWEKEEYEYTQSDWYQLRDDVNTYLAEQKKNATN